MTREEAVDRCIDIVSFQEYNPYILEKTEVFIDKIYDDFVQQIQKLQEENEHLKNMLQAHTKEK